MFQSGRTKAVMLIMVMTGAVYAGPTTTVSLISYDRTQTNPVVETENFDAGTYDITPIVIDGKPLAWNAWGRVEDPGNGDTSWTSEEGGAGWINNYSFSSHEFTIQTVSSGLRYATPELALEGALPSSFTLTNAGPVSFFINDSLEAYRDNLGGISLLITEASAPAVPVPGALLLAGLGSGVVGFMRRRRSV